MRFSMPAFSRFLIFFLLFGILQNFHVPGSGSEEQDQESNSAALSVMPWKIGVLDPIPRFTPSGEDFLVIGYIDDLIDTIFPMVQRRLLSEADILYMSSRRFVPETASAELRRLEAAIKESDSFFTGSSARRNGTYPVGSSSDIDPANRSAAGFPVPVSFVRAGFRYGETALEVLSGLDLTALYPAAAAMGADLLLIPELEKIGSVYIVRTWIHSPADRRLVRLKSTSFAISGLLSLRDYLFDVAAMGIGGYRRVRIELPVHDRKTMFLINGEPYRSDDPRLELFLPGTYTIQLVDPQRPPALPVEISLSEGDTYRYTAELPPEPERLLVLVTDPHQASVWGQSLADGVPDSAPALLSLSPIPTEAGHDELRSSGFLAAVSSPGYQDASIFISPGKESEDLNSTVEIVLDPSWLDLDDQISRGRIEFYSSLSRAILAMPVVILMRGLSNELESPLIRTAYELSVFTGGVLVLDTIFSLVDYYQRTLNRGRLLR